MITHHYNEEFEHDYDDVCGLGKALTSALIAIVGTFDPTALIQDDLTAKVQLDGFTLIGSRKDSQYHPFATDVAYVKSPTTLGVGPDLRTAALDYMRQLLAVGIVLRCMSVTKVVIS